MNSHARKNVINIFLAAIWLFFAFNQLQSFFVDRKIASLLFFVGETITFILFLVRRDAKTQSTTVYDYAVALGGTFLVFFFIPTAIHSNIFGNTLIVIGSSIHLLGISSLGRSFGIIPANRGVQTKGMYAFVRHPLYASYIISYGGYLISNVSRYNAVIFFSTIFLLVLRIRQEELILSKDPEYEMYRTQVHWKLFPGIF